ncbi:hypothetical protein DUD99_08600 [Salmonella enterica subsp. enterica]|nr:hypothetical protein [Salmonella enterica subsp. enterica]EAW1856742.1 hypothetical protein [Salmonella enterica subsp. enterica]EAW1861068.1 hypothetical protein [Salmonella enterica subsp. enterica]
MTIDHIYVVSSVHNYIYLLITVIQNYLNISSFFSVYAFIFHRKCAPTRKLASPLREKASIAHMINCRP